jgi:hypothetical protein
MNKSLVMLGMFLGSIVGGYVPVLFGSSAFSLASVFWSAVGGIFGIWAAYKIQV